MPPPFVRSGSLKLFAVYRFTVAMIIEIVYGHKVDSMDDPLVELAEKVRSSYLSMTKYLV